MSVSFSKLRQNYPAAPKAEFYQSLGGQWPNLVNDPKYANTCAIRLSVAFMRSGLAIPQQYKEAITGNGEPLAIKVKTMGQVVNALIGKSYWGISKEPGKSVDIPARSGIIAYHVAWSDATGHFDLWTGSGFVGSGNMSDIKDGFDVELWSLP